MIRNELDKVIVVASIAGAILITMLLLPILNILFSVGPNKILEAAMDRDALSAILISFEAALIATFLSFIFGVPLAYIMARKNFYGKSIIESIVDLPVVIPHTVAGVALLMVFGRRGIIGAPLDNIGVRISDSILGIVAAMMFVSAPFLINQAREGFESIDPRMENVAMSLGATRTQVLMTITLPLSIRNLLVGSIMTWARAISEFGAVIVIAYFPMVAPTYIYSKYIEQGLVASAPIAALLLLITVAIFVFMRIILSRWRIYDKD